MVWVVYCLAGFGFRLLASFELVGVGLCGVLDGLVWVWVCWLGTW